MCRPLDLTNFLNALSMFQQNLPCPFYVLQKVLGCKICLAISKLYLTHIVANGLLWWKGLFETKTHEPRYKIASRREGAYEGWFNLISGFQNRTWMRGVPVLRKRRQNSRLLKTWGGNLLQKSCPTLSWLWIPTFSILFPTSDLYQPLDWHPSFLFS